MRLAGKIGTAVALAIAAEGLVVAARPLSSPALQLERSDLQVQSAEARRPRPRPPSPPRGPRFRPFEDYRLELEEYLDDLEAWRRETGDIEAYREGIQEYRQGIELYRNEARRVGLRR